MERLNFLSNKERNFVATRNMEQQSERRFQLWDPERRNTLTTFVDRVIQTASIGPDLDQPRLDLSSKEKIERHCEAIVDAPSQKLASELKTIAELKARNEQLRSDNPSYNYEYKVRNATLELLAEENISMLLDKAVSSWTDGNKGRDVLKDHSKAVRNSSVRALSDELSVIDSLQTGLDRSAQDYSTKRDAIQSLKKSIQIRMRDAVRAALTPRELADFDAEVNRLAAMRKEIASNKDLSREERAEQLKNHNTIQNLFDLKAQQVMDKPQIKAKQGKTRAQKAAQAAKLATVGAGALMTLSGMGIAPSPTDIANMLTPTPLARPKEQPIAPARPTPTNIPVPKPSIGKRYDFSDWQSPTSLPERQEIDIPKDQVNPGFMFGSISWEEPVDVIVSGELAQMASTDKTDRSGGVIIHWNPLVQDQDKITQSDAFNDWSNKNPVEGYRADTQYNNHENLVMAFRAGPEFTTQNVVGGHASLSGEHPMLPLAFLQDAYNKHKGEIVGKTLTFRQTRIVRDQYGKPILDEKGKPRTKVYFETARIVDAHDIDYQKYDYASRWNPSGEVGRRMVADANAKGQMPPKTDDQPVFKDLGEGGLNVPKSAQGPNHVTTVTCYGGLLQGTNDVRERRAVITFGLVGNQAPRPY